MGDIPTTHPDGMLYYCKDNQDAWARTGSMRVDTVPLRREDQ